MSAPDQATWKHALDYADEGRPHELADLLLHHEAPVYVRERLSRYVRKTRSKNTGRPKAEKQTDTQARQWDGKRLFRRWAATGANEEWVLEKVKSQDRTNYPNEDPFTDTTWRAVFKGKRDEFIDPSRFSKKASLAV